MRLRSIFIVFLIFATIGVVAQQSNGDRLFYAYNYKEAAEAYRLEEMREPLNATQQLNFAESYFKVGQYTKAMEGFLDIFKKDSTMSNYHFNTMLQAMSKSSGLDRVKAFLSTRTDKLSGELLESASFNFELLENQLAPRLNYKVFQLYCNSNQSDFSASFYEDDQLLFSSARPQPDKETYYPTGEGYLDIYVSRITEGGQTQGVQLFEELPPSDYHKATPYYDPGIQRVFYVLSNTNSGKLAFDKRGKNALAIAMAASGKENTFLLKDLSTSFYYPFYDRANDRLYFAADLPGGFGGTDLYYVNTNGGVIMSSPVNLGPRINTPGNEVSPYIFEGSLFFASDVFYGLGGMDLYKAQLQADNSLTTPINLGPEINTQHDEFGLIIKEIESGYMGYFSSNRPGGLGGDDLYGFSVDDLPGLRTLVFRGRVIKQGTQRGIEKVAVQLKDNKGSVIREYYTGEEGEFWMEIPWREQVGMNISKEKYEQLTITDASQLADQGQEVKIELFALEDLVRRRNNQTLLKIEPFYFAANRAELTDEIAMELDKAAAALVKFPGMKLRIEAHTDSRGSASTNLSLSKRRAQAIKNYLISKGASPESIQEAMGYGEEQIINNCTDGVYCLEMLHRQNERYPMIILNYEEL
ncbi:OmpA family protein [Robiginitalea sp. IMCC43444]|uniref:OmpA family protein n=1 Tax=Robiginitalea sp. IMCC43444 TaxID=3459121 RepID=UPI0040421F08